jgi:glutaredoxin-like protein NrdH
MNITVYSKPRCPQCTATINKLCSLGIPYTYKDISQDEAAASESEQIAQKNGIRSMPIVLAGDYIWGGFDPDKLDRLATALAR